MLESERRVTQRLEWIEDALAQVKNFLRQRMSFTYDGATLCTTKIACRPQRAAAPMTLGQRAGVEVMTLRA